jgi:hypothetical protein
MHVAPRSDHLEFDDDMVLDYQVGLIANNSADVKDHDPPLQDWTSPTYGQGHSHRQLQQNDGRAHWHH